MRFDLHHDPVSAKSGGPKWVPTKNVGEASLAHNDLRWTSSATLAGLYQFDSHIGLLIQRIVGLDRNSDGFLDAVAYPPPCSEIELDSFPGRSSPETPRGETPSKIPVSASTNNCAEVQP